MNKITSFKNFNMGRELEICGEFIYESARQMYAFSDFNAHFEINKILYFGAVGIERLQKILLSMYKFNSEEDVQNAPSMFREHRHMALHDAIAASLLLPGINKNHISLLLLFQDYYANHRYGEFRLDYSSDDLVRALAEYYKKIKGTDIDTNYPVDPIDMESFRRLFINYLGDIAQAYYEGIDAKASELGIFTTEMSISSNAVKVFLLLAHEKLWDMVSLESVALKELIVYLCHKKRGANIKKITDEIAPLSFDGAMINEYLVDITRFRASNELSDTVYQLYTDMEAGREARERRKLVDLLGDPNVILD